MERRRCARHSRAQKTFCTHGSWNTLADFRRQFYISLTVNRVTVIQMKSGARSCRSALTTAQCSCSTATYLHVDLRRSSIPLKRSEEHTSELQSPYVISYAVFCLKK